MVFKGLDVCKMIRVVAVMTSLMYTLIACSGRLSGIFESWRGLQMVALMSEVGNRFCVGSGGQCDVM